MYSKKNLIQTKKTHCRVNFKDFSERYHRSSSVSKEIMLHCEIEKIWILYDPHDSGFLEIIEFKKYFDDSYLDHNREHAKNLSLHLL